MGLLVDSQNDGGGGGGNGVFGGCVRSLVRRKQVNSVHARTEGHPQLAKNLSVPYLVAIGNSVYLFIFIFHFWVNLIWFLFVCVFF